MVPNLALMELFPNYTFFIQLAIFSVALLILNKLVFKPILALMVDRKEKSSGTLQKLSELEAALAVRIAQYDKAIAQARAQAFEARDRIREAALREEKAIVSTARTESDVALAGIQAQVEREAAEAKGVLEGQANDLAILVVKKVLHPRALATVLVVMGFLGVQVSAWAIEHEPAAHSGLPMSLLYQFINFFGLLVGLFFLLKKPLQGFFMARRELMVEAFGAAERQSAEFAARSQAIEQRLAGMEAEITGIKDIIISTAQLERQNVIKTATALADKIRRDVEMAAGQEVQKARQMLREHTISLALQLARGELVARAADEAAASQYEQTVLDQLRGAL